MNTILAHIIDSSYLLHEVYTIYAHIYPDSMANIAIIIFFSLTVKGTSPGSVAIFLIDSSQDDSFLQLLHVR